VGWGGDARTLQNLPKSDSKIPLPRGGERNCTVCKLPSNYTSNLLQGCYRSEWVLELAPKFFEYQAGYQSWELWLSKQSNIWFCCIIMVIKKSDTQLVHMTAVLKFFWENNPNICLQLLHLCWFFHDTKWVLWKFLKYPKPWQFFESNFFSKYLEPTVLWFWKFSITQSRHFVNSENFQITRTSSSLVLK
jgi:hypothetical protein